MQALNKLIGSLNDWSGRIFCWLLYPAFLLLAYEVFMRYFITAPSDWTLGMSQRIFAVYYLMGGAYVLLHDGHIRMDLIFNKLSVRTRAVLDLCLTFPCLFFVCFVILRFGFPYALNSVSMMETDSTAFGAPLWPVKLFIPLVGIMLTLQALSKMYLTLLTALQGRG